MNNNCNMDIYKQIMSQFQILTNKMWHCVPNKAGQLSLAVPPVGGPSTLDPANLCQPHQSLHLQDNLRKNSWVKVCRQEQVMSAQCSQDQVKAHAKTFTSV